MDMKKKTRIRQVAYWMTTILGPASFVIGGVMMVVGSDEVVRNLAHLGYPAYFATILGVAKILGAAATVAPGLPRLKEWAYAGFAFDLLAASASHAYAGDAAGDIVAPLVYLALVMASWALRPADRRLAEATREAGETSVNWGVVPARG